MSANRYALPSLSAFAGASQVLFGSDFPFMPASASDGAVASIHDHLGADDDGRRVVRGNAEDLFPRLAEVRR